MAGQDIQNFVQLAAAAPAESSYLAKARAYLPESKDDECEDEQTTQDAEDDDPNRNSS